MPPEGEVVLEPASSVSVNMPAANQGDDQTPANAEFIASMPESFRDKPWIKEFNDLEGLLKSTEDTKAAFSKRPAGIPQENASAEEKAAFYKSMGVPESAEGYTLQDHPEGYTPTDADAKFRSDIQKMFLDSKQTPGQAAQLEAGFQSLVDEVNAARDVEQGKSDEAFVALSAEVYGDKAEATMAANKAVIEKHMDSRFSEHLGSLDNKSLMLLSTAIDGIRKEFMGEDTVPSGDPAPAQGALTNDDIKAKAAAIMSSPEFSDPTHVNHTKAIEAKNALFAQLK